MNWRDTAVIFMAAFAVVTVLLFRTATIVDKAPVQQASAPKPVQSSPVPESPRRNSTNLTETTPYIFYPWWVDGGSPEDSYSSSLPSSGDEETPGSGSSTTPSGGESGDAGGSTDSGGGSGDAGSGGDGGGGDGGGGGD